MKEQIYCRVWTINGVEDLTTKQWLKFNRNKLHRLTGPTVELTNGNKWWYKNGKRHRIGGPAVEYVDGTKYWIVNGKRHRIDGPAIEYPNGTKHWFVNGQQHRTDGGCAIEWTSGTKQWWINGIKLVSKEKENMEVENWIKDNKIDLNTLEDQMAFKLRWT